MTHAVEDAEARGATDAPQMYRLGVGDGQLPETPPAT